jgi:hypothetical protein
MRACEGPFVDASLQKEVGFPRLEISPFLSALAVFFLIARQMANSVWPSSYPPQRVSVLSLTWVG